MQGKGGVYVPRGGQSISKQSVSAKPEGFYSQVLASGETRGCEASYWINLVSKTTYIYVYMYRVNQRHPS